MWSILPNYITPVDINTVTHNYHLWIHSTCTQYMYKFNYNPACTQQGRGFISHDETQATQVFIFMHGKHWITGSDVTLLWCIDSQAAHKFVILTVK